MIISQKKKGGKRVMEVSGNLTVSNSLKLKNTVLENLGKGEHLELAIGEVEEIDLSFIQILLAAMKTAEKNNREFTLRIPVPEAAVESLKLSGFLNHNRCDKPGCVWCSVLEQVQGA